MRTFEQLEQAIIACNKAVVKELIDEAVAAGLDHTDDCTPSPDLLGVVVQRCGFSPAEAAILVRENGGGDPVLRAVVSVLTNYELKRTERLRSELLAALLDDEALSDPGKLLRLVKAALER